MHGVKCTAPEGGFVTLVWNHFATELRLLYTRTIAIFRLYSVANNPAKSVVIGVDLLFIQDGRTLGTDTYIRGLLGELQHAFNLVLFTTKSNQESFTDIAAAKRVVCNISGRNRYLRILYQQLWLPRFAQKLGVSLMFYPGYLAPLRSRIPSIVTIHDCQFADIPQLMPVLQRLLYWVVVPAAARRCDAILTDTHFSKRRICEVTGVTAEKIHVCPAAPRTPKFAPCNSPRKYVQSRFGVTVPYLLSVGSGSPHKNIAKLVESFERYKRMRSSDCILVLAGPKQQKFEQRYPFVREVGFVSDSELDALYLASSGFVLASLYEGFGLPVLEAMQHGVPVACSNLASLPEIAGEAAILFNPHSIEEMAEAIGVLLEDKAGRAQLIEKGYSNVERFSWPKCAAATSRTVNLVLRQHGFDLALTQIEEAA